LVKIFILSLRFYVLVTSIKNEIKLNFDFCNCGSDNQVLSQLNALLKKSEKPDILGVILDADKDVNARYQNTGFSLFFNNAFNWDKTWLSLPQLQKSKLSFISFF
jgi:hypothetical protein